MSERPNPAGLTAREMQMCDLLVSEGGVKPASYRLPDSTANVRLILRGARHKYGVRNLVLLAVAHDRVTRGAA